MASALRRMGWRTTVVPAQCEWVQRRRIIRMERPDVIVIQKGRHPANWPRYYPDIPLVFDLDDADFLDAGQAVQLEACCRGSRAIIAGSSYVARWCRQFNSNTHVVWTCAPVQRRARSRPSERRAILTWAHSEPFLAPAEAEFVRDIALNAASRTQFEFWLYGVRDASAAEQYLAPLRSRGVRARSWPLMPYGAFVSHLGAVAVGLNPVCISNEYSRGKSFGKVLAYLTAEVATVCHPVLEYPRFFEDGRTALFAQTTDQWADAATRLLHDRELRQQMAIAAYEDYVRRLTPDVAAGMLDAILRSILN